MFLSLNDFAHVYCILGENDPMQEVAREVTELRQCPLMGNRKCNPQTWNATGGYTDGCCSSIEQCAQNEGDCSNDNECLSGLVCGKENCPKEKGFDLRADCCELPSGIYKTSKLCTLLCLYLISSIQIDTYNHK